jgi:hypothetical protein
VRARGRLARTSIAPASARPPATASSIASSIAPKSVPGDAVHLKRVRASEACSKRVSDRRGLPRGAAPLFVGIVVACGLVGVENAARAVTTLESTVGTFVDLVLICRGEAPRAQKPACETITVVDECGRTFTLSRCCVRAELLAAVTVNFRSCQRGLANSDPGASVQRTRGAAARVSSATWCRVSTAAKQNQRALDRAVPRAWQTDSMKNFWVEGHRDANEEHSRGEERAGRCHERDLTAQRIYSL